MNRATGLLLLTAFIVFTSATRVAAAEAEAAPVAMTTDVQGAAWLIEGSKKSKLGLMAYLGSGATVRLEAGARISVTYFAMPREFSLSGPAQAIIEAERLRTVNGAAPVMRNLDQNKVAAGQQFTAKQRERQTVATFEMKAFVPGTLQLRQPSRRVSGLRRYRIGDQPVDTRLLGAPEEFSWRPLLGAKSYRFQLMDAQGRLLYSAESTVRNLRLPESVKLQPGQSYSWTVEAQGAAGEPQNANAGFSLVDTATAGTLEAQRPLATAGFSERLLYASLLENAGLKVAAQTWWKALASERPEDEMLQELANR